MFVKFLFFFLCIQASFVNAFSVVVKDQQGKPVSEAVVAIKGKEVQVTSNGLPIAVMDQKDKQYVPHVLLIKRGQKVSFPNSDNIRHHVYSFSEPKRFEIKLYADTPEEPILFDKSGLVVLGCNIHDSMLGYIFVSPWENAQITDDNGMTKFEMLEEPSSIEVWHPKLLQSSKPIAFESIDFSKDRVELAINLKEALKSRFKKDRWR